MERVGIKRRQWLNVNHASFLNQTDTICQCLHPVGWKWNAATAHVHITIYAGQGLLDIDLFRCFIITFNGLVDSANYKGIEAFTS